MLQPAIRPTLPQARDRLRLGRSGLAVSPICLGITESPATVLAAYDAGVNFFFLTADLHWPLYEGLRRGLEQLLARGPAVRDEIVVGVVSYLEQPMFQNLPFQEVLDAVAGLKRVDLLLAGAVADDNSFRARLPVLQGARAARHVGARAIGASFHHRPSAVGSLTDNCLDINYIRYNSAHTGARQDLFPHLRPDRTALLFNFKSAQFRVTPERFRQLGLNGNYWFPQVTDYYRFVLTNPNIDGVLCSPASPRQVEDLLAALADRPLTRQEEAYLTWLSFTAAGKGDGGRNGTLGSDSRPLAVSGRSRHQAT
jgi:hypothetical protein